MNDVSLFPTVCCQEEHLQPMMPPYQARNPIQEFRISLLQVLPLARILHASHPDLDP